jgi:hypothetical protein
MITRSEEPRRRSVLEIAIAVSIGIHLLFGGVFFPLLRMVHVVPQPKETPMVALSDVVTIEKRTVPRPEPVAQRQNVQPRRPTAVVQKQPERPKPTEPVKEPRRAVAPAAQTQRQEIAAKKPGETPRARNGVAHAGAATVPRPESEVALAPPQPRTPSQRPGAFTQQDLAALQRQFSQTIADARARSNPLNVPTEPPEGEKRYPIQIRGIYGNLRTGEGILTPTRYWSQDGYTYYYVNYEIVFSDGRYDSGSVPWPIRYHPKEDPFILDFQHFPLPCPLPGYTLPTVQEFMVMRPAMRGQLHECYPDHYPDTDD